MYLAEPVEGRARRWPRHQQRTRGLRILCRIIPFASPLHDFGAIEQALTSKAHEVGLTGTPVRERNGPLVGAAQIEGLLTGFQHAAIDVTGQDWRHVAGNHRDHRFVEQRDACRDITEVDEGATASVTGKRRQIAIAKPVGDFGRLSECSVPCRRITMHDVLNGGRNQQISAHDTVEVRLVEDPFSSGEPTRGWSDGAALQQSECKPGGGSGGAFTVASIEK